ncbi:MAG: phage tail protein [Gammaproteobacteria bacterium]|nr:phage tail protein [Gammaproteobacteria bacterium]
MATTAQDIATTYPIPVYRYTVDFGGEAIAFSEVSGLELGVETIVYKDGLGVKRMPGQPVDTKLTMKRGIVKAGSQFYTWLNSISLNQVDKKDITISLTDETGATPIVTWKVFNAFPSKLSAPSFDAKANDVAIESLELMADKITIQYA